VMLKENEKIELKRSTSLLKEAIISIVAILNKHGKGELYFGIDSKGNIRGQQVTEKTLRDISQRIAQNIEPRIFPKIEKVTLEKKDCIKICFKGDDKPYFAFGIAYIRVADEDRKLSPAELRRFILKAEAYSGKWDKNLTEVSVDEINRETFNDFLIKVKEAGRLKIKTESRLSVLNKLELIRHEKLTEAAKFLFTDKHSMEVQAAVFAGKDKVTFLDIKKFNGNLFDLLDRTELYLKERLSWRVVIGRKGMEREEIPEIPIAALREALVNSLIHRDFSNPKGNEIAVFKNRIEIYNPGFFPEGLTPEDFIYGEEHSYLRNPKIAEIFYYTKDVERWASGLKRIYDECTRSKVKVEFRILKTGFVTIFYRKKENKNRLKPEILVKENGKYFYNKNTESSVKSSVKSSGKIVHMISDNPKITIPEMAEALGITTRAVEKQIAKLKREGKIKRIGPDKGGYWKALD